MGRGPARRGAGRVPGAIRSPANGWACPWPRFHPAASGMPSAQEPYRVGGSRCPRPPPQPPTPEPRRVSELVTVIVSEESIRVSRPRFAVGDRGWARVDGLTVGGTTGRPSAHGHCSNQHLLAQGPWRAHRRAGPPSSAAPSNAYRRGSRPAPRQYPLLRATHRPPCCVHRLPEAAPGEAGHRTRRSRRNLARYRLRLHQPLASRSSRPTHTHLPSPAPLGRAPAHPLPRPMSLNGHPATGAGHRTRRHQRTAGPRPHRRHRHRLRPRPTPV